MEGAAGSSAAASPGRRFARLPLVSAIAARFRGRPDTEHEMAVNRLVISVLVTGYLLTSFMLGSSDLREPLITIGVYSILSLAFFIHILARPGVSVPRRIMAMCVDLGTLSYGLHVGDEITSLLYPIYLWTIFGNGFRFGLKYLFLATLLSLAGFSVVVTTTEYWSLHVHLAIGLLAGLVVLPMYAATLINKLSAARQQAEEASRAKSRFLTSVSHELRTPLNAIIALSDLLRDSALDAEQLEMTQTIGTAGSSLLALIDQILDLSRIEERRIITNIVELDLLALLADVRAILSVQAHAKSVRFAVHITARTPRRVKADKRHLEEILLNLGGNAVKFTERGAVTIAVDAIAQNETETRLRCEVTDTGIGIAAEAQARIFESFTQADDSIIDRFGGTGLGLSIVKHLVEFYGGRIGVDSAVGAGSTFWFELGVATVTAPAPALTNAAIPAVLLSEDARLRALLAAVGADVRPAITPDEGRALITELRRQGVRRPVAIVDGAEFAERTAAVLIDGELADAPMLVLVSDGPLSPSLRSLFVTALERPVIEADIRAALQIAAYESAVEADGLRGRQTECGRALAVLVAEDNRTNQMVIAKILSRAGHRVRLVDNGEAALDALTNEAFDLVLMDVNMPVMNGIEATKLYRFASLGSERIPIIALTADATAEASRRCEEAGMDACVTKPIEPARLIEIVEAMALQRGATAAPASTAEGAADKAKESADPVSPPRVGAFISGQTLEDLQAIGGREFVVELAGQFAADAASILGGLVAAVAERDAENFRERAHALRSSAANIGAHGIYEMCLAWRQIGTGELARHGREHVARLEDEIAGVCKALAAHVAALQGAAGETAADYQQRHRRVA
jgi:two-component system sensor histidine kinase RpfC